MSETMSTSGQNLVSKFDLKFGEEIEIAGSGFSFHPIEGFNLEIDGSVYMYSEDGNLEISLCGGELKDRDSIAELNDELAEKFLEDVENFELIESGTDNIQRITGFLNEIRFTNTEGEGFGRALICSPYINQYFFIMVIASGEYWQKQGPQVFEALKSRIHFHSQFKPDIGEQKIDKHPDLTIESFEMIAPEEDFLLTIEKGDVSLLLAARLYTTDDVVAITRINAPDGKQIYQYEPISGEFSSTICSQPLRGDHGEVCFFFPRANQQSLHPGDYRFTFATETGITTQEVQVIIRAGRALDLQTLDFNFWLAVEHGRFNDPNYLSQFEEDIYQALKHQLTPFNFAPGRIECLHPAPDELETFAVINLDTDLADCSYMIAESVNNGRALNIGLVEQMTQGDPPMITDVRAVSCGSPGMILAPASPHACILVRWPAFEDDIDGLANSVIEQLIVFSGIDTQDTQQENQPLTLNREIAWRLRRHPIFYEAG